jgi:hypothetical protein
VGTSDAAGYVRLPPVYRVAQLRLRVHHSADVWENVPNLLPGALRNPATVQTNSNMRFRVWFPEI